MSETYWNPELETKAWREVERWQAQRIARFVDSLRAQSVFYRARLAAIKPNPSASDSLAALQPFAFTTKDDLRLAQENTAEGNPFGVTQNVILDDIVQAVSSSGTTGNPVFYALTKRDLEVWNDGIANMFFTCGVRRNDVVAHLVGLPMVAGGLPYADAFRRIGATLAWLGGFPTERILSSIRRLQVSTVLATTSFGVYLTDHCRDLMGYAPSELGVKKYLSGGEPGLAQPEIRQKIASGWGIAHVREMMGLGDVMSGMWGECDDASGMHFSAQRYVAVELIDPDSGEQIPWREGASGEAVYTTFEREATPLLRFRSRDHVVVTGMHCRCGRTSPKIHCIGRTDDMLIYKAMNVFPSAIRAVILTRFADVAAPYLRIVKEQADQVRFDQPIPVEVEAKAGVSTAKYAAVAAAMQEEVRNRLQVRLRVSVLAPESLPRGVYKTPLVYVKPATEKA